MPGQSDDIGKGVTLRLSACPCKIRPDTAMDRCCGSLSIVERHRCRYGINSDYRPKLTGCGMPLSGLSPGGKLVVPVELSCRPFFLDVRYHPEFKSRRSKPHPMFVGFIGAAHKIPKGFNCRAARTAVSGLSAVNDMGER